MIKVKIKRLSRLRLSEEWTEVETQPALEAPFVLKRHRQGEALPIVPVSPKQTPAANYGKKDRAGGKEACGADANECRLPLPSSCRLPAPVHYHVYFTERAISPK